MSPPDLVLRAERVVTPAGVRRAAVHVQDGTITAVTGWDGIPPGCPVEELGAAALMPGLVDAHVHVNEPGRTDWEGFASATRAAAAGGVTTLVDMPLNAIPATTTRAGLEAKRAAAAGRCHVDVGFWGGVVPGNAAELTGLWAAGVLGFKCFLTPSGVDEFGHVGEAELREAMPVLGRLGAVLLAHAEHPAELRSAAPSADPRDYATYLATRPPRAEVRAIELLLRLAAETGCRVHIVHLAAAEALPLLQRARARGVPVTAETCPHYLHFAAEEIAAGATAWKCAPPLRGAANRERLWEGLMAGTIDLVASDHSPCPPGLKCGDSGDFLAAWGGIASLQLSLPVLWEGTRRRGYTIRDVARWMSAAPARLAGLAGKGAIAPGMDADLVAWDPDAALQVDPANLHHRHPLTPYAGAGLHGRVRATWLRGVRIFDDGRFPAEPSGALLLRPGSARPVGAAA